MGVREQNKKQFLKLTPGVGHEFGRHYIEASSFLNLIIMMLLFIKIVKPDTPCGLKFDN
jgi:hypothetical protein